MQDLDTLESVCLTLDSVLTRLASAYRSLPESKLLGRLPDGRTRATAGHELAALIASAAQGVEDRSRPSAPSWRPLPYEGPFVVGDQLGVTGHDLLAACSRLGGRRGVGGAPADGEWPAAGTANRGAARDEDAAGDEGSGRAVGTEPEPEPEQESVYACVSASTAVWAPPGVRCDRTGVGRVLTRVLAAAEELAGVLY